MQFQDIKYYSEDDKKECTEFLEKYSDLKSIKRGYLTPRACIDFCLPEISKLFSNNAQIFMEPPWDPE